MDGLRELGSGGGFFPIGGGGPFVEADDIGRGALLVAVFLRFAMEGTDGGAAGGGVGTARPGTAGAAPGGGLGAPGGFGAPPLEDSGSERYDES